MTPCESVKIGLWPELKLILNRQIYPPLFQLRSKQGWIDDQFLRFTPPLGYLPAGGQPALTTGVLPRNRIAQWLGIRKYLLFEAVVAILLLDALSSTLIL